MFHPTLRRLMTVATLLACVRAAPWRPAIADGPSPRLTVIDPPGGKLGSSVDVQVSGTGLRGSALYCDEPRIKASSEGDAIHDPYPGRRSSRPVDLAARGPAV